MTVGVEVDVVHFNPTPVNLCHSHPLPLDPLGSAKANRKELLDAGKQTRWNVSISDNVPDKELRLIRECDTDTCLLERRGLA